MNTVERIKSICKDRRIPMSKLEKDLGFSNAYISGLKKGVVPDDRLRKIADYFGVSIDFLMTGREKDDNISLGKEYAEVIRLYSGLTKEQQAQIVALMRTMIK